MCSCLNAINTGAHTATTSKTASDHAPRSFDEISSPLVNPSAKLCAVVQMQQTVVHTLQQYQKQLVTTHLVHLTRSLHHWSTLVPSCVQLFKCNKQWCTDWNSVEKSKRVRTGRS